MLNADGIIIANQPQFGSDGLPVFSTVTVTDGTNIPVGVRAGFKPYAEPMYNLYNSADLLATPFRLVK